MKLLNKILFSGITKNGYNLFQKLILILKRSKKNIAFQKKALQKTFKNHYITMINKNDKNSRQLENIENVEKLRKYSTKSAQFEKIFHFSLKT